MGKDKIAFVVVRYGADINGGAEYHCRMLAERLVDDYDVEVLTTCVKDYMKGGNDIAEGAEYINRTAFKNVSLSNSRVAVVLLFYTSLDLLSTRRTGIYEEMCLLFVPVTSVYKGK